MKNWTICFWKLYSVGFTNETAWHRIIRCMWEGVGNLMWLDENKDININIIRRGENKKKVIGTMR